MLRPGGVARPALARAFTTKLSWAGSPQSPTLVMTKWLIVNYHCRTFAGWTDSLMGCEQRTQRTQRNAGALEKRRDHLSGGSSLSLKFLALRSLRSMRLLNCRISVQRLAVARRLHAHGEGRVCHAQEPCKCQFALLTILEEDSNIPSGLANWRSNIQAPYIAP